ILTDFVASSTVPVAIQARSVPVEPEINRAVGPVRISPMRKSHSKPNLHRSPPMPAARPIEGRQILREAPHFIFDVEGTLVDTVMATLCCWRTTLEGFGFSVTLADLHRYSGMDGSDMLARLLPQP